RLLHRAARGADAAMIRTSHDCRTLVELLQWRAQTRGGVRGYTFLVNGETEGDVFTYGDLDRRAREIAAGLQRSLNPGDRALLLYPPGLEFIAAFFGCLYAGVVAVPTYPPQTRARRGLNNLRAIADDGLPAVVLTTPSVSWAVERLFTVASGLRTGRLLTTVHTRD